MPRFVFENRSDNNRKRALYDSRRGRSTTIASIDEEYVNVIEHALGLQETYEGLKKAEQHDA